MAAALTTGLWTAQFTVTTPQSIFAYRCETRMIQRRCQTLRRAKNRMGICSRESSKDKANDASLSHNSHLANGRVLVRVRVRTVCRIISSVYLPPFLVPRRLFLFFPERFRWRARTDNLRPEDLSPKLRLTALWPSGRYICSRVRPSIQFDPPRVRAIELSVKIFRPENR